MPKREWPFPGDSPVARARKMALAYRSVAQEDDQLLAECAALLDAVDRRLIAFDNPAVLTRINDILKKIQERPPSTELDQRFSDWGQDWHAEIPITYEQDDYITARQAAPLLNIDANTIGRLRIDGRIKGEWDPALGSRGGWTYKVADIWELSTKLRGRNWRTKERIDRVNDDGSSDEK